MKLILPIEEVPIGSTVTKATGTVEFVVREKLVIYEKDK